MFSSVRYEESSWRDFVCPVRVNQEGWTSSVRYEVTRKMGLPRPSGMRNHALRTSFIQSEVVQKLSLSSFVRYEESSRWDFVHLVRRRAKGEHVLVCPIRGINQAGIRQFGTKSRERSACPRPFGTKSHETNARPRPSSTRNHA